MSRILCTSPFPRVPAVMSENALVITPHRPAAEALGCPGFTLQNLARRILAKNDLFAAEPRMSARLLRESIAEVKPGADASAMAQRIASVLKTVLRIGIDTGRLKEAGGSRAAELASIAERFRCKLRERGSVHIDEIVWEAANAAVLEPQILFIYGYNRGRSEEIAFIDRIAGDGSIYHLPVVSGSDAFTANANFAAQLAGRGWTIDTGDEEPITIGERTAARFFDLEQKPLPSSTTAYGLHDVSAEVRFVLANVKKLLRGGTLARDIAVVARDLDLYAKEFSVIGAEYSVPTISSLRIPLSETLVGGFLALLLTAVERDFTFDETARLLGHPFGPGMSDETWAHARRHRTDHYYGWHEREPSLECLDSIRDKNAKPAAKWVECLRSVVAQFDVRARAGQIARETAAYNCLQEELSFIAEEDAADIAFSEFSSIVRDVLANVKTDFDPSRLGVLITEPHMVAGGKFRHLFVLGMAEGVLPALPVDSNVIDFHERRGLARQGIDFEEAADIPRWESLSFISLLSAATESVTLTYPKTINGEEKIASSFFGRLGLKPQAAPATIIASSAELLRNMLRKATDRSEPTVESAFRRLEIESDRESANPCGEFDGVLGEAIEIAGRHWSVSQINTLAGCGFRWFAGYGLGVKPPDEMELDVSPAARGKLYHYALDFAVSQGGAKTRKEIIHLLDHALASGYNHPDVGMPRVANWDMRRADHVAELTRAVEAADFLPVGSEILAAEQSFLVTLHGLRLRGRIDRVDRSAAGVVAVDYKTSSKKPDPVRDRDGRKLDLQIAVYLAALAELYPQANVSNGVYYSLSSCKSFAADAADELVLRDFLAAVVEAPQTGSLPVRPLSKQTCEYCDYDPLCRNGSRIARKEAAQ